MNEAIAVVLGMGPTALSLVRALGRKGVRVYGIGLNRWELSLYSRYCRRLGAADPRYEPDRLLDLLVGFAQQSPAQQQLVLYPTGDESLAFIAEHCHELGQYYRFSKLDPSTAELFLNKARFHHACEEHGFPVPATFMPTSCEDLVGIAERLSFPCILKPKHTHLWAMTHGLRKVVYCNNRAELLRHARALSQEISELVVQEVIEGPEENIYTFAAYFDRNSQPHGCFVGQKIRQYPVDFGTTTVMRTADVPELVTTSVAFMQSLGYQGLCDVEYKLDPRTNIYRLIEVNPRIGRWYGIVEAAGVDTLYCSYLDLSGQPITDTSAIPRRMTWVFVCRDVLAVLARKPRRLGAMIHSYARPRTWCVWAKDDILPFFAYCAEIASKSSRLFNRRVARTRMSASGFQESTSCSR